MDIRGKEIVQIVSTKRGNEKSVANIEESIEAVSKAYQPLLPSHCFIMTLMQHTLNA